LAPNGEVCKQHSGCISDIEHLKFDNAQQWKEIGKVSAKVDAILTRLNVVLGSLVVAIILFAVNIAMK